MKTTPQNKPRQVDTEQRFRPYDAETETAMKRFYDSLSEKDRRRYAGIEAVFAAQPSDLPAQGVDKRIRQTVGVTNGG